MHLQVVLTSTNPSEICVNGMSFSRRSSKWANAALVVTVSSKDFESMNFHGHLAGVEFQVCLLSTSVFLAPFPNFKVAFIPNMLDNLCSFHLYVISQTNQIFLTYDDT